MDINLIKQVVLEIGIPSSLCVLFMAIIWDAYKTWRNKFCAQVEEQALILEKQTKSVESMSRSVEIISGVLDKLCTTISHVELMAVEATARTKAREEFGREINKT